MKLPLMISYGCVDDQKEKQRMSGYVRPLKGDLRVREFARYRSIYCGLCKAIAGMYGHIARAAVT